MSPDTGISLGQGVRVMMLHALRSVMTLFYGERWHGHPTDSDTGDGALGSAHREDTRKERLMAPRRRKEDGRPTKLTPAIQDAIVHAVSQGVPFVQAALLTGVSGYSAQEWLRRGEGREARPPTPLYTAFAAAIAQARAQDEARRVLRITQAAQGGAVIEEKTTTKSSGEVTRYTKYKMPEWQADAWILERSRPETWGQKTRMDVHLAIQQIATKLAADLGLTPEAILAEAQLLLQEADRGRTAD
jgi:transposase